MFAQIVSLAVLAATASAGLVSVGGHGGGYGLGLGLGALGGGHGGHGIAIAAAPVLAKSVVVDYHTPAQYEFKYGVEDPKTGDNKQQSEVRHGDVVKGEYSVAEPDGTIRVVKYTADDKNGFNAVVSRIGHAVHPQIYVQKAAIAVPAVAGGHGGYGLGAGYGGLGGHGSGILLAAGGHGYGGHEGY